MDLRRNPPAFPFVDDEGTEQGMNLRDHFAGQAVTAATNYLIGADKFITPELIAKCCYEFADAMLAERAKGENQ